MDTGVPPGDAAEFVAGLRRLKDGSGFTFRQLEQRAASQGEVLPRSTIADVLRKAALPRPAVLAAFVRACGRPPEEVDDWLAARDRLAAEDIPQPQPQPQVPEQPRRRPRVRLAWAVLIGLATAVLLGGGAWIMRGDPARDPARDLVPGPVPTRSLLVAPAGSWARLRPARTPHLCVSEGREHTGRYPSAIAVQLPCTRAEPPRTFLEPIRDGLVHIQWHHPEFGVGCLTVLAAGPAKDMLEPWDDCTEVRPAQAFRIAPVEAPAGVGYRLHAAAGDRCLGLRDNDTGSGAEVLAEPCTGEADQVFVIELLPPGATAGGERPPRVRRSGAAPRTPVGSARSARTAW